MSPLPDHYPALETAAGRLAEEFRGTYGRETIDRFVRTSYDQFVKNASVTTFLPLLAERFARQRLQASAKVEGHSADGRPVVLFMCVHNAGRSQMARGFFQHLAGDAAVGWSGGSEPGSEINPLAVQAMKERGIDVADEFPKPWTDETVQAADAVISMGCGDACPIFPGKRYEEWELEDPAGQDLESVRVIRDQIEERVRTLLSQLDVEPRNA
jgi:arsenate reductase